MAKNKDVNLSYTRGVSCFGCDVMFLYICVSVLQESTVTVSFWAGNPRNDLMVNTVCMHTSCYGYTTDWEDIFNS